MYGNYVVPENIHTPSHRRLFKLNLPPPPLTPPEILFLLVSYFPSKNWAFETPSPLGISVNLPWGGHGYFLEQHMKTSRAW